MEGEYLPPDPPLPSAGGSAPHPSRRFGRDPLLELVPSPGAEPPPGRPRWGRAILLFALTFLTTTTLGSVWLLWAHPTAMVDVFPWLSPHTVRTVWTDAANLRLGLSFAVPALFIMLCHELGHYLACRHYGLAATLPYFLPMPAMLGTLGAFIRIRSPIEDRRQLFDVGVAGPLAGFVALLPFLLLGIAWSEPVRVDTLSPAAVERLEAAAESGGDVGDVGQLFTIGHSLGLELVTRAVHGPLPPGTRLHLHPFALAAWFGLLVTSLNLLPLGQLDGGHILYAALGRWQHRLAWPFLAAIGVAAVFYPGWLVWFVLVLLLGPRHPPVRHEEEPLDRMRLALAVLALVIFVLSFMPAPVEMLYVRA